MSSEHSDVAQHPLPPKIIMVGDRKRVFRGWSDVELVRHFPTRPTVLQALSEVIPECRARSEVLNTARCHPEIKKIKREICERLKKSLNYGSVQIREMDQRADVYVSHVGTPR